MVIDKISTCAGFIHAVGLWNKHSSVQVIFFSYLNSAFSPWNSALFCTDGIQLPSEGVMPSMWSRRKLLMFPHYPNKAQIPASVLSLCGEKSPLEDNHVLYQWLSKWLSFIWGRGLKTFVVFILLPPNCSVCVVLWSLLMAEGFLWLGRQNGSLLGLLCEQWGGCECAEVLWGSWGPAVCSGGVHISRSNCAFRKAAGRARLGTWKEVQFTSSCLILSPRIPVGEGL